MNEETKKYFLGEMQSLAALFERVASRQKMSPHFGSLTMREFDGMKPTQIEKYDSQLSGLKNTWDEAFFRLYDEFEDMGEPYENWEELMVESGAAARMEAVMSPKI
jgi:hypothetical protein